MSSLYAVSGITWDGLYLTASPRGERLEQLAPEKKVRVLKDAREELAIAGNALRTLIRGDFDRRTPSTCREIGQALSPLTPAESVS